MAWLLVLLYSTVTLWTAQVQSLTGDEPHYLLAARSLVRDGDADLGNDYEQQLYREFYPSDRLRRALPGSEPALDPHDVPGLAGERRPVHQLGASLLLLPGYLLAGRAGALAVAVLIGTLAGLVAWRLAAALNEQRGAWYGGWMVVLLSPLVAFCGSLHAEPAAALAIGWLGLLAVRDRVTPRDSVLAVVAAGGLAWLHVKFVPAAALLVVWLALDGRRRQEAGWWWPAAGLAVGLVSQLALFAHWFGSWSPSAAQLRGGGKFPGAFSGSPWTGVPGLLVDQQDGLLVTWPAAGLAVPGFLLLWRDRRARRLLAVIGLHFLLIATYRLWRSGFAPAGRQLLPVVPLLAPFVGAGASWLWARRPSWVTLLAAVNGAAVVVLVWLPRLRYPAMDSSGASRSLVLSKLGLPALDVVLPLVGSSPLATGVGWVYLVALAGAAVVAVRRAERRSSA